MKNKLLFIASFFTLTIILQWLIGPWCDMPQSNFSIDINQLPHDGTLVLYYDAGKGFSENFSSRVYVQRSQLPSKVVFQMPIYARSPNIRIRLPGQQGDIELAGMDFGFYHWGASDIKGSFSSNTDLGEMTVDGGVVRMQSSGPDPYLTSMGNLDYVYAYAATRAAAIRAFVFLICLLAFFAIVALLTGRGRIDQKVGLSILRASVFYCTCIMLLIPCACTVFPVRGLPVFENFENRPDISEFSETNAPIVLLKRGFIYSQLSFAFRDLLIRWNSTVSMRMLNESPIPAVISGRDGWFFLNYDDSLSDHLGLSRLSPQELQQINLKWTYIKNYLDSKGIYLLVVFAPDKETIYPEFMPERLRPFADNTRLDQVIAEIRTIPGLNYIDLRSILKSAKGQYPLYYKDDSHWNNLGAFISYQEIARRLAQRFGQVSVPEIKQVVTTEYIHGSGPPGTSALLIMKGEFPDSYADLTIESQNTNKITTPSLLFFQDSFFDGIEPFFRDYFKDVATAGWNKEFDPVVVEREHPEAVIFIMVERRSNALLPQN